MIHHLKSNGRAVHNRLLANLPPLDFGCVESFLEPVELGVRRQLFEPRVPNEYVYFPDSGMVSIALSLANGNATDVGIVANEGFVGMSSVLGSSYSTTESIAQISGHALRIDIGTLRSELGPNMSLRTGSLNAMHDGRNQPISNIVLA